jgi:uncharacterized delta-60 repeat protein
MRSLTAVIRLLCLLFPFGWIQASDFIDPTFRAGVSPITRGPDGPVYAMAQFPDGSIVIAGDFARVNGVRRHAIARLLTDGSLDTTFDAGQGPDHEIKSVVALADGSVLVGGRFGSWGNELAGDHVVRLKPDGTLDHGFAPTPAWDGEVAQILLRSDGSLMVLERLDEPIGLRTSIQQRFANGFIDGGFTPAIIDHTVLNAMALATNGDLLIAGRFSQFDHQAVTNLVRLKADNSVDTTFMVPAAAEADELLSVASAGDGRLAIGGVVTNGFARAFLAVLQPDGRRDPGFAPARGPDLPVVSLVFDTAGVLMLIEQYPFPSSFLSSRYSKMGEPLTPVTFILMAKTADPLPLPDGNVVWATDGVVPGGGPVWSWLLRTFPDATIDPNFIPGSGGEPLLPYPIRTMAVLPDGTALALGKYGPETNAGTVSFSYELVRLDSAGTAQTLPGLRLGLSRYADTLSRLLPAGGQQFYVAGGFPNINGNTGFPWLARLNGDGTLDPTFKPNFLPGPANFDEHGIYDLARLNDGRLYAGGFFRTPDATRFGAFLLGRFLMDGTLDPNFVPLQPLSPGDASTGVFALVPLDPDRVLFWGRLDRAVANSTAFYTYAARSQTNGASPLLPGPALVGRTGGSSDVSRLVGLPDGRVLVAGSFSSLGGVAQNNLAILRPDLSVDPSFDIGAGPDLGVSTAIQLTDGRILVAGAFTHWNGQAHRRLLLLQPDGRMDESFDPGTGPDDVPYQLLELPDGRVLIGGRFANLDGRGPARLARLVIPPAFPPIPAHLTLQPHSAISANLTAPVVLKAAALGTPPLRYQWFRDGVALTEGGGYAGVTNAQLLIQGTNLPVTAGYHVEVANDSGRERSADVVAGLASGTMDPGFATDPSGHVRLHFDPGTISLPGLVADTGPDGRARRILLFGNFTQYDQQTAPGLAVIHPDGSRDASWAPPGGVTGADTVAAAFLPDGRLMLAGKFARARGAPRDVVMRLNQNGSLDTTFDPGDELTITPPKNFAKLSSANALALDGDGIFLASQQGVLRRLNATGRTDPGFLVTNLSVLGTLSSLAVEPVNQGGLLVGGNIFAAVLKKGSQTFHQGVARILRDGRLDTNYNAHPRRPSQSAVGNVSAILPAPDGSAFVAGDFAEFDSAPGPLVHLDAGGQADTNFVVLLPGTPPLPFIGKSLLGVSPLADGNFLLNYKRQTNSPDTILLMQPDGTLNATGGGSVESSRGTGQVLPLGDGSYLVQITLRATNNSPPFPPVVSSSFAVGRFFLSPLAGIPVTNVPPVLLRSPGDVALTNRPGYREPLVLSAAVQSGSSVQVQWHRDGVLLADQTNATLFIAEPRPEDSGHYRLDVSNAAGSVSAEAAVVIRAAVLPVPALSVGRRPGEARLHLHFSPQPGVQYRLERAPDLNSWQTVTDPEVRVSDSEFALPLSDGAAFFRLVPEP